MPFPAADLRRLKPAWVLNCAGFFNRSLRPRRLRTAPKRRLTIRNSLNFQFLRFHSRFIAFTGGNRNQLPAIGKRLIVAVPRRGLVSNTLRSYVVITAGENNQPFLIYQSMRPFPAFLAEVVIIANGFRIAQMSLNRFILNGFDFAQVNHAVARVFLWRVYGVVFSQNEQLIRFRMLRQCRNAFEIKRLTALNGYLVQFAEL